MDIKVNEASGVPFYRQIEEQIMKMIQAGSLQAGDPLPSVRKLAGSLLVSLITIRRAYSELENGNWIVRKRGHGTYVAENAKALSAKETKEKARSLIEAVYQELQSLGLKKDEIHSIAHNYLQEREEDDGNKSLDRD